MAGTQHFAIEVALLRGTVAMGVARIGIGLPRKVVDHRLHHEGVGAAMHKAKRAHRIPRAPCRPSQCRAWRLQWVRFRLR